MQNGYELESVWFNQTTARKILATTDFKDHYNKYIGTISGKVQPKTLAGNWNSIFPGKAVNYNAGYMNDAGTLTRWIPDNKLVLIAKPTFPGEIIDVVSTTHINPNTGKPESGKSIFIDDRNVKKSPNPRYGVVAQWYGLPRLRVPKKIVVVDCEVAV